MYRQQYVNVSGLRPFWQLHSAESKNPLSHKCRTLFPKDRCAHPVISITGIIPPLKLFFFFFEGGGVWIKKAVHSKSEEKGAGIITRASLSMWIRTGAKSLSSQMCSSRNALARTNTTQPQMHTPLHTQTLMLLNSFWYTKEVVVCTSTDKVWRCFIKYSLDYGKAC